MSTRRGIIAWFARNSVAANLLMWLLLIGGLASAFTIQREIFPDIEQQLIAVNVAYPGASPEEVEDGVVLRIEEAIEQISGIKQVTSVAEEGLANVTIEVQESYDLQQVLDEVKLRVDAIVSFPETIEKPLVYELKFEKEVIWVQLMGEVDERALKELAQQIRDEIVALPEVSTAEVFGARDYEIAIEVSESKLLAYGITFDEVATAVRNSSLDLPSGTIRARGGDILVRAKAQAYDAAAFGAIVVRTYADGRELRIRDLAEVIDGFSEDFGYARFDGKPTVGVQIKAVGDEDAMRISAAVNRYVEQRQQTLPASITLANWGDSTYYLKGRLDLMLNNMRFSALLVFMTLAAFLPLRPAFWVMVGL
ncbi:MAG: efflux RND transporter permease subunit, partial [Corallincola sp.]|nr:efflux RND transporter permease subunit [Corallincola sp.]